MNSAISVASNKKAKNILTPKAALNPVYRRLKSNRTTIEQFKQNFTRLIDQINESETEEFHKNIISNFLKRTYYGDSYYINTKGYNDLVIHTESRHKSPVGVIIETKSPTNRSEMTRKDNLNTKALQELLLYYLRERISANNVEIKHLIITNIYEWFVFDASEFEKYFAKNRDLVRKFQQFEDGRLGGKKTEFFYKEIAAEAIRKIENQITFTYFDIRHYEKILRQNNKQADNKLIAFYKLLTPEHLLKLPFRNDSNTLDKAFYAELLHIIGLTETKDGSKKLIERKLEGERDHASLIENTIAFLDSRDKLTRLEKPRQYGETHQERLFNVGLELVITWVNRVLFLKLLEAQLIAYHGKDTSYQFLSTQKIKSFDHLDDLFFKVLARKPNDRGEQIQELFGHVPYLNSSLFEPSDIEHKFSFIGSLQDERFLPIHPSTVLKDKSGKRRKGELRTLDYLFEFLNAYDFASEGAEVIQEENKTLINASVLGLIFEKINGYKDGSFFTPGFVTMYMCRESIRKAIVEKFNAAYGWQCKTINDIGNHLEPADIQRANDIINSLKICDPAVGSGHFLVSALNELIAIKSELRILKDPGGQRLRYYQAKVINDELVITDEENELFEYKPQNPESQRIQETFFHEKATIIENCLFGVDINPNSVKICRLRLWIELLKHAYYTKESDYKELETLPNIDINIKCGNSLISRFTLNADLGKALKDSKWNIESYKLAVQAYRRAKNKSEKHGMERLINDIKGNFRSEIDNNSKEVQDLRKYEAQLFTLVNQTSLLEKTPKEKKAFEAKVKKLSQKIDRQKKLIDEIKNNKIYENAFEWRFEFPEVLSDNGDFEGFNVIIGNPPYIRQEEISWMKPFLKQNYKTYAGTADIYVFFVELGVNLLTQAGQFSYILPNKWMRVRYGKELRDFIQNTRIEGIYDFGDLQVFDEATTYPCMLFLSANIPQKIFPAANIATLNYDDGIAQYLDEHRIEVLADALLPEGWILSDRVIQELILKIRSSGTSLHEYTQGTVFRGVLTGLNAAFVIDTETRDELIARDPNSADLIKPFLAGRDIKRYEPPSTDKFLIFTRRGIDIQNYPAILDYLEKYREQLTPRPKDWSGGKWPGRKPGSYAWYEIQDAVDYYEEFEKPKIIYPNICKQPEFTFDADGQFTNQKCFIISQPDDYLLGILNSRVTFFLFEHILPKLRGDYYEPSYVYFKDFPIAQANDDQRQAVEKLVQQTLLAKQTDITTDTLALEKQIDALVYQLYDFTPEEIRIIDPDFEFD